MGDILLDSVEMGSFASLEAEGETEMLSRKCPVLFSVANNTILQVG